MVHAGRRRGAAGRGAAAGRCRLPAGRAAAARPPPPPPACRGGADVRVGITVDSAAAVVGATTDFTIRVAGGDVDRARPAGEAWTFTADEQGRISGAGPAARRSRAYGVAARDPGAAGGLTIGGRQYRGEALIIARAGGPRDAVNVVDLEAYLLGVVPREIGRLPGAQIEATRRRPSRRAPTPSATSAAQNRGFDFYATVMDQVYGGVQDEDSIVNRAVRETRGEIMTYNGTPILAYYASTCGGTTAPSRTRGRGARRCRTCAPCPTGSRHRRVLLLDIEPVQLDDALDARAAARRARRDAARAHRRPRHERAPRRRRPARRPQRVRPRDRAAHGGRHAVHAARRLHALGAAAAAGPAILNSSRLSAVEASAMRRRERARDPRRRLGPRHRHVPGRRHQPRARRADATPDPARLLHGVELQRLY
jgi:hypothetical protein